MPAYTIRQLRGAFAAGRRAAEGEPGDPAPSRSRRERWLDLMRRELLAAIARRGLTDSFPGVEDEQGRWVRCLARETLRVYGDDPDHDDGEDALWDSCRWLRNALIDRHPGATVAEIDGAVNRLTTLFRVYTMEYYLDMGWE